MKTEQLLKKLRKFETDLGEVVIGVDLDYQRERLKKILDDAEKDMASTQIHGGGTGKN